MTCLLLVSPRNRICEQYITFLTMTLTYISPALEGVTLRILKVSERSDLNIAGMGNFSKPFKIMARHVTCLSVTTIHAAPSPSSGNVTSGHREETLGGGDT